MEKSIFLKVVWTSEVLEWDMRGRTGEVGRGRWDGDMEKVGWDRVWDRRGGTVEVGWEKKSERGRQVGLGTR